MFDHTAITENTYGISWESAQHSYSEVMNMTGRRENYIKNVLVDAKVVNDIYFWTPVSQKPAT
jgi:hypothetical protein